MTDPDPGGTALLMCPVCGAMNKPHPAKPILVREQDGSYSCTYCGTAFKIKRPNGA